MSLDSSLILWFPVWGEMIQAWRKYCLPALMQSENLPELVRQGCTKIFVDCWTEQGQENEVLAAAREGLQHCSFIELNVRGCPLGEVGKIASREGPKLAFDRQCRMLICPADIIWGNGSIANMCKYAYGKPVTVGAAHLRVSELPERFPISNRELVEFALRHPHQSQSSSWSHHANNATFMGGISLTPITPNLTTIVHALPAPWLCWFTKNDVDYFSSAPHMNLWDQDWPTQLLLEKRWRVLGSSELAFAVELTKPHMNRVIEEGGRKHFEGCVSERPHNQTNGSLVISLVHG